MLPLGASPSHQDGLEERARQWRTPLAILVGVRVAIPLLALAYSGRALPGQPHYRYQPFNGDSFGYYAASREFIASVPRVAPTLIVASALLVAGCALTGAWFWRRSPGRRVFAALLPAAAISVAVALVVREMHPPGAAVFGWPLVWAIPMIPLRLLDFPLTPDVGFAIGLTLTLLAIGVTTVATAYVGLWATGRRSIGLIAAGLFAVWPLVTGQIVGDSAWENGQWNVDVGLHLYTEPISTALVVTSVALLLRPGTQRLGHAGAGVAVGYATAVKLTNGLVGLVLLVLVACRRGRREAIPFAAGGLIVLPILVAYWPKGYAGQYDGATSASARPWALSYVDDAWGRSSLYTPRLLFLLAPLLVIGCVAISDRWALAVVSAPIAVNAAIYSFYDVTAIHPRFLYVALPFVFVLEAAGAVALAAAAQGRRRRSGQVRVL